MEFITFEIKEHIGVITLNRPPVNSLSLAFYKEMEEVFNRADSDNEVWVAVLQSSAKHFCAGNDITEFDQFGPAYLDQEIKAFRAANTCRKPIIVALNGAVMGGGIAFGCCGDITIAADTTKFSIAEINMGLCGTLSESAKQFPMPLIRYMALTGEVIKAAELEKYGFIWKIVPMEELHATAFDIAKSLTSKPPLSLWKIKAALDNIGGTVERIYRTAPFETNASLELAKTKDHKEAYTAFLEKRAPIFSCE